MKCSPKVDGECVLQLLRAELLELFIRKGALPIGSDNGALFNEGSDMAGKWGWRKCANTPCPTSFSLLSHVITWVALCSSNQPVTLYISLWCTRWTDWEESPCAALSWLGCNWCEVAREWGRTANTRSRAGGLCLSEVECGWSTGHGVRKSCLQEALGDGGGPSLPASGDSNSAHYSTEGFIPQVVVGAIGAVVEVLEFKGIMTMAPEGYQLPTHTPLPDDGWSSCTQSPIARGCGPPQGSPYPIPST